MILIPHKLFLCSSYKRVFTLFLFSFLFSLSNDLKAQWLCEINGTVTSANKKLEGAIVTLYKGTTQVQQVRTSSNGKFVVTIDQEFDYTLTATKPGFITKKLLFSTKGVPTDIAKNFEKVISPEIAIFEIPKDPAVASQVNSILNQPMAKFLYDPTEFDIVFDKEYSESMLQELNRLNSLEKEAKKKEEEEAKNQQLNATAVESKYNAAIAKGDAAFSKKDYANSKTAYQDALTIKKGEAYPLGRIVEIEKLLADASKNAQQEADYKAAIVRGDQAMTLKNYDVAKGGYTDALKIKPAENYPKSKLDEIAKLLADANKNKDLDAKYNAAIAKADKAFAGKTYEDAKASYTEALALKSAEKYPKTQLAEIDRLLNELNTKNKSAAELLEKYKTSIAKADKAFSAKDYSGAKNNYKEASGYQPAEVYPKDKIAEIDKLLAELANKDASEKERQAKEKELNAKYDALIAKADKSLSGKEYAGAKSTYKEALALKTSEQYPKDKINEIDKLLTSQAGKEAEEKNRLLKEGEINDKYNAAITAGDKAMGGKDYNNAKSSYTTALGLKANEKYPKTKLDEIEKLLAGANELNAKYTAAIAKGDAALKGKVYDDAKKSYKEALSYKSTEQYPKDKLAEIEGLLAKETGAKELDAKYNSIISKADKALSGKDYADAKSGYNEALAMKPAEVYPKTKLAEIEKALADAAKTSADKDRLAKEKELNDKYQAIISKADKAMGNKDYEGAKGSYTEALGVKPVEQYPKTKLAEIDKLLGELANKAAADKDRLAREKALNEKYAATIAKADAAFSAKQYGPSKAAYNEAIGIKSSEQYPKDRITEIDKLLAAADKELEQKYKTVLAKADAAFGVKDYANARPAYMEASEIKASEVYPKDQVKKIDILLAEANKDKELKTKYNAAIASGDANMLKKDYPAALAAFKEAQSLRPSEPYPNNKISEINNLLDGLARAKEKDKQYADLIAKADKSFASKDYKAAKGLFLDASLLKPTEKYPKDKVIEIDNILNPKTAAPVVTNKAMDDFRNALAKKYPQGITEESVMEGNLKVVRRIVVNGADAHLYLKKTTTFGAIYYFKDDISITEKEFVSNTEVSK
jgi:hypothetical protein